MLCLDCNSVTSVNVYVTVLTLQQHTTTVPQPVPLCNFTMLFLVLHKVHYLHCKSVGVND